MLQIGFGEAGASIIAMNLDNSTQVIQPIVPGRRIMGIFGFCDGTQCCSVLQCLSQCVLHCVLQRVLQRVLQCLLQFVVAIVPGRRIMGFFGFCDG